MWKNQETGHTIEAPFDLAAADLLMCAIAGERAKFDALTDKQERAKLAGEIIERAMRLARLVVGDDALDALYNALSDEEEPKTDLITLAARVSPLSTFFAAQQRLGDPVSPVELMGEILAVANGDAPRIFAKRGARQGRGNFDYRTAIARLKALCWLTFLDEQGVRRLDADYWVSDAFGVDAKTIRDDWPWVVRKHLGEETVAAQLADAKEAKRMPYLPDEREFWKRAIRHDGDTFRQMGAG